MTTTLNSKATHTSDIGDPSCDCDKRGVPNLNNEIQN